MTISIPWPTPSESISKRTTLTKADGTMLDIGQSTHIMVDQNVLHTPLNWDRSEHISREVDWDRPVPYGKHYFISCRRQQSKTHWLENTARPGHYGMGLRHKTAQWRLQK